MAIQYSNPVKLPVELDYGQFAKELASAQYTIGLLEGSHKQLANALHLIGPLVAKEAAISSKIEGTQSTSTDIYVYKAGGDPRFADTPVVSNYRDAMYSAIGEVRAGRSISLHTVRRLHQALLTGVRHKGALGKFRNCDVWIGEKEGDPIEAALYIPPHFSQVQSYMENLHAYMENNSEDTELVKAAVIHYQFEAVHPFEDGNGRIGRLLIPIILFYRNQLSLPVIYSSGYFEAHADEYRNALRQVDKTGKFEAWLKFFLTAIEKQATSTLDLVNAILMLHGGLKSQYASTKSPYLLRAIDIIFESPVLTVPHLTEELGCTRLTSNNIIHSFVRDGVLTGLEDVRGARGANLYAYTPLIELIS